MFSCFTDKRYVYHCSNNPVGLLLVFYIEGDERSGRTNCQEKTNKNGTNEEAVSLNLIVNTIFTILLKMTWSLIIDGVPPQVMEKAPLFMGQSVLHYIKIRMKTLNTADIPKQHKTISAGLSLRFIHRRAHPGTRCFVNQGIKKKMANNWQI